MSRSIKDLRELVCVSRLTMREDDDEEEDLSRPLTSLSLFEERLSEGPELLFNSGHGSTNGVSSALYNPSIEVHQTTLGKTKHVENINNNSASLEARMEFGKQKSCLPPVRSSSQRPSSGDSQSLANERQGFYDDVLKYLDEESVSSWLHQANQSVTELTHWCQQGENFVGFCHFWLTEFSLDEQLALVKLEIGVLLDEIGFALRNAISSGKIREADVKTLFSSLLPEYPGKLCSPRGQYVFLNILNTLSSGKTEGYKKLLTNVKLHTRQSDIAQRALSIRAYIVINLWKNVTQFYVNVKSVTQTEEKAKDTRPQTPGKENTHLDNDRIFQAVRRGNVRVLHYMLSNSCGSPSTKDGRGQSLALAAVLNNQARILKYLLTKVCFHFISFLKITVLPHL